ncbi:MAG: zf-HC2 domain-containing protein [Gemmatimonadota bacterium]|nr:zf-HC2 domain-containing protein [Gemmatimonadota bacterium]
MLLGHEVLVRRPMLIDCDAVVRELWDFLDEELSGERIALIEAHVALCERCGPHVVFGRAFKAAVRTARDVAMAPAHLGPRVREALRAQGFSDPR